MPTNAGGGPLDPGRPVRDSRAVEADTLRNVGLQPDDPGSVERRNGARRFLTLAAEAGDPAAQFDLASVLAQDSGVLDPPPEAERWLLAAAEQGHGDAVHRLGSIAYFRDPADVDGSAEKWWQQAAETGHVDAQHDLGVMYFYRDDLTTAEEFWRQAAISGHSDAAFQLAALLLARHGRADPESVHWLSVAAHAGHQQARQALAAIAAKQLDGERHNHGEIQGGNRGDGN